MNCGVSVSRRVAVTSLAFFGSPSAAVTLRGGSVMPENALDKKSSRCRGETIRSALPRRPSSRRLKAGQHRTAVAAKFETN